MRNHPKTTLPGRTARPRSMRQAAPTLVWLVTSACTSGGTPRGMSEVAAPQDTQGRVGGFAAAAQTGAPAPSAPTSPNAASDAGAQAADSDAKAAPEAQEVFAQRCVLCHGPKGQGNGVAAENLKPKPRNLQEPAWQNATSDADIAAIILKGGANVGKSMMMPPNPDLADKPKVVEALVRIVRGFTK